MQYLVGEINSAGSSEVSNNVFMYGKKEHITKFYRSEETAKRAAEELAAKYPGQQFGIFTVGLVYETSKPNILTKIFNERGELVLNSKPAVEKV